MGVYRAGLPTYRVYRGGIYGVYTTHHGTGRHIEGYPTLPTPLREAYMEVIHPPTSPEVGIFPFMLLRWVYSPFMLLRWVFLPVCVPEVGIPPCLCP